MTNNSAEQKQSEENPKNFSTGKRIQAEAWGVVAIQISKDAMKAEIISISETEPPVPIKAEMIIKSLKEMGLAYGLLEKNIIEFADELYQPGGWEGTFSIAIGKATSNTLDSFKAQQSITDSDLSGETWKIGKHEISFTALKDFFSSPFEEDQQPDFQVIAFKAGETIFVQPDADHITPGRDIFGREVVPVQEEGYSAGENVELNGNTFSASCYGYLMIDNRTVSIIIPIKISDDSMLAAFYKPVQCTSEKYPSPSEAIECIKRKEISFGFDKKRADIFCENLKKSPENRPCVMAQGRAPKDGEDAKLIIERHKKKKTQDDENNAQPIDFKELDLFHSVAEGDHVATKLMPTPGKKGKTLLGQDLSATDGKDLKLNVKEGIRVEENEEKTVYYASTAGIVNSRGGELSVTPLCIINGDVNFAVGNLDIDKDLQITGAVCSDFSVKTKGSAQVIGMIEPSANLQIGGDLEAKQGIIGEDTRVVVLGNLNVSYIQDATVMVKGDLTVASHIYNAKVTTIGKVIVEGKSSAKMNGSIAGGTTTASNDVEAVICGSPSNVETYFSLQINPLKREKLKKIAEAIVYTDHNITKIMRTLQLSKLSPAAIGALLSGAGEEKKKVFVKILHKMNTLVKNKAKLLEDQEVLRKEIKSDLTHMSVIASKSFYGNCTVKIDKHELQNREDLGASIFRLIGVQVCREDHPTIAKEESSSTVSADQ